MRLRESIPSRLEHEYDFSLICKHVSFASYGIIICSAHSYHFIFVPQAAILVLLFILFFLRFLLGILGGVGVMQFDQEEVDYSSSDASYQRPEHRDPPPVICRAGDRKAGSMLLCCIENLNQCIYRKVIAQCIRLGVIKLIITRHVAELWEPQFHMMVFKYLRKLKRDLIYSMLKKISNHKVTDGMINNLINHIQWSDFREHSAVTQRASINSVIRRKTSSVECYLNTSMPQPAIAVKSRGPRSLAGFNGYPQFMPMDTLMPRMIKPIARGSTPLGAPIFLLSVMARMHSTSVPVPITCSR